MKTRVILAMLALVALQVSAGDIRSGEIWPDDRGVHINAHGGGIICHDQVYYWYGEHKSDWSSAAFVGVTCYSSRNLTDWKYEGVALSVVDARYYKEWWTPSWRKAVKQGLLLKRDFSGGQMSRDMALFLDDDGKAYHIFSSEENLTMHIAELTDDFTAHTGKYTRVAPGGQNEAPAIFKQDGTYWVITSGCTGWDPNEARMFSAPSIWGPWTRHPNPCRGPRADKTFGAQSTFALRLPDGRWMFMADIWKPRHPIDARYVWLPIQWEEGKPVVEWKDAWSL